MRNLSIILILFFAVVSFVHAGGSDDASKKATQKDGIGGCVDPNSVFNPCRGCEEICGDNQRSDNPCATDCSPGCECREGFIRESPNGLCIPKDECKSKPNCGDNEEYLGCGSTCEQTCTDPKPDCSSPCTKGCFCKKNFIRESEGGPCILENKCENFTKPPHCGIHEEWDKCRTRCEPTCSNRDPELCPTVCRQGCYCRENYIRESRGGPCIPEDKCPVTCTTPS